jgi:hypothetical protein
VSRRASEALQARESPHDVRRFLSQLMSPGDVHEVRIPKYGKFGLTASGYFQNSESLAEAIPEWDRRANLYITLNPVDPALLARAANRIAERAANTTSDGDILRRRWLPLDIDAVRPSGISSTDSELAAAREVLSRVVQHLSAAGWPQPVTAMSGNGYYALYRVDLPNDPEATDLVQRVLRSLAERFDTEGARIDTTVSNASRIVGLVGTLKCKGDDLPDRPHRRSRLEDTPGELQVVTRERLEAISVPLASERPTLRVVAGGSRLVDTLRDAGIEYREQPPDANGITWYHVRQCPWHDDGRPFECGVGQKLPDGPYAAHCFHPEGQGKTWQDWKVALGLALTARPDDRVIAAGEGLPQICISRRHRKAIVADAWDALKAANEPARLFRHGRGIAELARDEGDRLLIAHLSLPTLSGHVDRCADFMRATDSGLVPARPPRDVIEDMDAMVKPLPILRGIVGTPVFAKDGTLVTDVGYQPLTRLFYEPVGEQVPAVPLTPDVTHLRMAKEIILLDWLGDFPFVDDASRANAIAIVVTAIAREMIPGPTPLFAIDAPSAGTGKGLLISGAGVVISGNEPAVMPPPRDEAEFRKLLTAKFCEGAPLLLFDNLKRRLDSPTLAAALTAEIWSDRILGRSKSADAPVRNVWVCTGNNLQLTDEIARRSVWTRLDAKRDRAWEGRTFRHPDLKAWLRLHRHELVWAFLVLVQHWVARGRPEWDGEVLGSYEDWSRVAGGVLQAAGIGGFMENRQQLYERADAASEEWRRFTQLWWDSHEDEPVAVGELLEPARELLPSVFTKVRDDASDRSLRTRLGKALAEQRDRRFADYFIRDAGIDKHTKGGLWRLEHAADAEVHDERAPSSAHLPQAIEPVSDSFAEGAELAEDDPGSIENNRTQAPEASFAGEGGDRHPQHPHLPQSDSIRTTLAAEDARKTGDEAPHLPQDTARCIAGCGRLAGRGQRCRGCARDLLKKWGQDDAL